MADILPPAPIGTPFGSYSWEDWYRKVRDSINNAQTVQWSSITGLPTTVAGYGITDAIKVSSSQVSIPSAVNDGSGVQIGTLTNGPTTGNPTKWISVNDNGTTRYIPAW